MYFTDFSSASTFDVGQTTSTENPARTSYMYAAPEVFQINGELLKHCRGTDVFSLGAVFCEMLVVLMESTVDRFHRFLLKGYGPERKIFYGKSTLSIDRL